MLGWFSSALSLKESAFAWMIRVDPWLSSRKFNRFPTYTAALLPISGQSRELAFQMWDDRALLVSGLPF
jgi:hypothetical protein